jgi:hypothetical protein
MSFSIVDQLPDNTGATIMKDDVKHSESNTLLSDDERSAFISDTFHRVMVEAARIWVIEAVLRTGELPDAETRFCYANGPHGFDWGNAPGPCDDGGLRPMRGKRIRVSFEVEDKTSQITEKLLWSRRI